MTDIDPDGEIELRTVADAAAVPAQPESDAGHVSIVVILPVAGSNRQIAMTMDSARALIAAADAASLQPPHSPSSGW